MSIYKDLCGAVKKAADEQIARDLAAGEFGKALITAFRKYLGAPEDAVFPCKEG